YDAGSAKSMLSTVAPVDASVTVIVPPAATVGGVGNVASSAVSVQAAPGAPWALVTTPACGSQSAEAGTAQAAIKAAVTTGARTRRRTGCTSRTCVSYMI